MRIVKTRNERLLFRQWQKRFLVQIRHIQDQQCVRCVGSVYFFSWHASYLLYECYKNLYNLPMKA